MTKSAKKSKSFNIGDRFGSWVVLDPVVKNRKIVCLCERCGVKKEVDYVNLVRGASSYCGCGSKMGSVKVGDQIGNWKILSKKGRKVEALCIGCEVSIRKKDLVALIKNGGKKSCGCLERKDGIPGSLRSRIKPGDNFGLWEVKECSGRKILCRCTGCGKEKKVEYLGLLNGSSRSCGCQKMAFLTGTNQERYGTLYSCLNEEVVKKKEKTCLERYGVIYVGGIPESLKKQKQTMLERYGVEKYAQLPENRKKLKIWCEENPDKLFASKPEQEILDWVREFYPSARKHKEDGQEIDVLIPELGIGIEYNRLCWHSELGMKRRGFDPKRYHLEKTRIFKEKKVRIIHIWEHHWRDRKEQVKSFLRSALKLNENKLAARKCRVIWSNDKKEIEASNQLLDLTHIQGEGHATKWVANIYHEDRLVATASFARHHRNGRDWVLTRFTTKANYTVQGALSKISRLARKNLEGAIVSWADLALSEGDGYLKAGWRESQTLPADYFYYNPKTGKAYSKQSRQKRSVKTPKGMTELEHASLDGLTRVWDCGKIRFSL